MANKKNEAKVKFSMETAEAREQTKKAANEIKILRSELRLSAEEMRRNSMKQNWMRSTHRLRKRQKSMVKIQMKLRG